MSRPVYEPSLPRADAELGYGSRQLFRRPGPGGLVVPCFRAYQWSISQSITNNNDDYLRWDRWETSDAAVMDSAGWIAGTPDFINTVMCKERGLYLVHVFVNITPWGTVGGEIGVSVEDAGVTFTGPPMVIQSSAIKAGDASTGSWAFPFIMSFPPIWIEQTTDTLAPDLPEMRFKLFNKSGATIDTTSMTMVEIHRLYTFDYETLVVQSQA